MLRAYLRNPVTHFNKDLLVEGSLLLWYLKSLKMSNTSNTFNYYIKFKIKLLFEDEAIKKGLEENF